MTFFSDSSESAVNSVKKTPTKYKKMEVLNDKTPGTSDGLVGATMGLKPLANLLQDVEKSYVKGKNIARREQFG